MIQIEKFESQIVKSEHKSKYSHLINLYFFMKKILISAMLFNNTLLL